MSKQPTKLEWQICEDEGEWRGAQATIQATAPSTPTPVAVHRTGRVLRRRRVWLGLLLLILLPVLVEGYREVRQADEEMDRIENEVVAAVAADAWRDQPKRQSAEMPNTPAHPNPTTVQTPKSEVRSIEVLGDYARVEVWRHGSSIPWLPDPYRQTRFYHATEQGWLTTDPPDIFWQPLDTLQVGRFTFVYGARDGEAVREAAAQVEAVDAGLRAELGLPATDEALTVTVIVEGLPPSLDAAELAGLYDGAALYVPSPALLALPAHFSDGEALLQSVAALILTYALDAGLAENADRCAWQSVADGLHRWLLGEHTELPSMLLYKIQDEVREGLARGILPRLAWFGPMRDACSSIPYEQTFASNSLYESMAYAFVEYAVSAYGRERLPALIEGMKRYDSWEELIPAVYGVSTAEFEAGWREWLLKDES